MMQPLILPGLPSISRAVNTEGLEHTHPLQICVAATRCLFHPPPEVSNQTASPEQPAPGPARASSLVTWRCHSILVFGFKFTDGEQHHLDGPNENTCQAAVEDDIEEEDLNCKRKQTER